MFAVSRVGEGIFGGLQCGLHSHLAFISADGIWKVAHRIQYVY